MNESKKELIKSYFYKKLSEAEKKDILAQIEASKELKEEFTNLELLQKVAERNRILEQARQIHANKISEFKTPKDKVIPWVWVSSAVAAACLVFTLYLGNSDFEYTEISQAERGSTAESSLSDFDKGINLLKNNQAENALIYFDKTINNQELTEYYKDVAQWYKVVALAKMDKDEEAKTLLNQIENSTGFTYKIGLIEKWKMKVRLWI